MLDIGGRALVDREHELEEEVFVRLEHTRSDRGFVVGEFVRRQTSNLPPHAPAGAPLAPLGVSSLGHTAAFLFDPATSVLAHQFSRSGTSPSRLLNYVAALTGGHAFGVVPVLTEEMWAKLQQGRLRGLRAEVSSPETLAAADNDTTSVREGFRAFQRALGTSYVEAHFKVGRGEAIERDRAIRVLDWFRRQRSEDRGGVRRLYAEVVPPEGGPAEILNLIGAQAGGSRVLDLPPDPEANYQVRAAFVREVYLAQRDELVARYQQHAAVAP